MTVHAFDDSAFPAFSPFFAAVAMTVMTAPRFLVVVVVVVMVMMLVGVLTEEREDIYKVYKHVSDFVWRNGAYSRASL